MKLIQFPKVNDPRPWFVGRNTWRALSAADRLTFKTAREANMPCRITVEGKTAKIELL